MPAITVSTGRATARPAGRAAGRKSPLRVVTELQPLTVEPPPDSEEIGPDLGLGRTPELTAAQLRRLMISEFRDWLRSRTNRNRRRPGVEVRLAADVSLVEGIPAPSGMRSRTHQTAAPARPDQQARPPGPGARPGDRLAHRRPAAAQPGLDDPVRAGSPRPCPARWRRQLGGHELVQPFTARTELEHEIEYTSRKLGRSVRSGNSLSPAQLAGPCW
jgi:hypothetical protein